MSRQSARSSPSSSATSPSSSRIDLGKDSGVDMGRKSQVSATSGGVGITQEITTIGGMQIEGGVSVDITPIDFEVSSNGRDRVSIAASAEVPGGILGVGGGVTIDTGTGQIKGGSVSGEVGGVGISITKNEQGFELGISIQIPFTPITLELGFGPKKEEKKPTATPTPTPRIEGNPLPGPKNCKNGKFVLADATLYYNSKAEYFAGGWRETRVVEIKEYIQRWMQITEDGIGPLLGGYDEAWTIDRANQYFGAGNWDKLIINRQELQRVGAWLWDSDFSPSDNLPRVVSSSTHFLTRYVEGFHKYQFFFFYPKGLVDPYSANRWFTSATFNHRYEVLRVFPPPPCPFGDLPPLPPPPNPPPRKQMDQCCRDSIKLLRAIYSGLGIQKFPGQLPSTIIQEVEEEGATPAEPPQEPIADFADLLMWMFHRDDERWGQWQIQIKVKDSDLTKEGDQAKQVKFPNLAESVAEIEGQLLSLQANVEALVAISVRNLTESGMARQEAIKAYLASMAIAKYMNFPYEETDVEIPSTFTPGAEGIDQLVKESTIHAKGIEYTNKETQRDILLDLLQAAAITRAVHWRQVDPKKDIKSQILENIKRTANLSERLNNPIKADGDQPKTGKDWEDFLDQVEDGFGYEAGIENAQTPYGRSRDRRPRIRQIGENIDQAGKADG